MKSSYTIVFVGKSAKYEVNVGYVDGVIQNITFHDDTVPDGSRSWMAGNIPGREENLGMLSDKGHLICEAPKDFSFPAFWEAYGNKVNKDRAYTLWTALPEADRVKALTAIPKYDRYLDFKRGIEKKYPDTWLKNRCWNDTYNLPK